MEYVFKLSPPSYAWAIFAALACALVVALLLVILPPMTFRITVSKDRIVAGGFMIKTIVVSRNDVASVEISNLSDGLKPVMRLWGYSIGPMKMGFFKLENGENAFMAVSQGREVVVVRTKEGKLYIFGPSNIDSFIDALRICGWIR